MVRTARGQPVQFVAVINYQAQTTMGAIIRAQAACTFNLLDGSDAPTRPYWVMIDGERNLHWAKRQPEAATFLSRILARL